MSSRETLIERLEEFQTQLEEMSAFLNRNQVNNDSLVDTEPMTDLTKDLLSEVYAARQYVEDNEEDSSWNGA